MKTKLSKCCESEMLASGQCLTCGADGRKFYKDEFIHELFNPKYELKGNGNIDTIKCWGCGERIEVGNQWEARNGHFYCSDCGSEQDNV